MTAPASRNAPTSRQQARGRVFDSLPQTVLSARLAPTSPLPASPAISPATSLSPRAPSPASRAVCAMQLVAFVNRFAPAIAQGAEDVAARAAS